MVMACAAAVDHGARVENGHLLARAHMVTGAGGARRVRKQPCRARTTSRQDGVHAACTIAVHARKVWRYPGAWRLVCFR